MLNEKVDVRVLLRHYWKKGLSIRKAVAEICAVEGDVINKSAAGKWLKRFSEGDMDLEDKPRSGRPVNSNMDQEV